MAFWRKHTDDAGEAVQAAAENAAMAADVAVSATAAVGPTAAVAVSATAPVAAAESAAATANATPVPALAEDPECANCSEVYRAKAAASKQEIKKTWITFFATGVIVLALVVVFIASLAWFANNRQVQATGMTVQSDKPTLQVQNYDILYCDYATSSDPKGSDSVQGWNDKFAVRQTTDMKTAIGMISLDLLSINRTSRNKYAPVVVHIPVSGDAVDNLRTLKVTLSCSGALVDADNKTKIARNFSNIMQAQCAVLNPGDTTDNTVIWNYAYNNIVAAGSGVDIQTYVTALETAATIDDVSKDSDKTLTFELSNYGSAVVGGTTVDGKTTGGTANIYLVLDYNMHLAETYIKVNNVKGGDIGELEGSQIKFDNDFVKIVITDTEN